MKVGIMKRKKMLSLLICLALHGGLGGSVYANAESFRTPEYDASTGLKIINAADAYALGFTGKGIVLGITDHYVKFTHPEFVNKPNSITLLPVGNYDFSQNIHGTHVGGTMAAAKDNAGMHGVAFDANLVSGLLMNEEDTETNIGPTYAAFNNDSRVKVINNSWTYGYYMDELRNGAAGLRSLFAADAAILESSIIKYDKVLIFAGGNDGHPTPGGSSMMPYLYPSTAGNFVNVVSIDPAKYTVSGGKITADTNFVSIFSNLAKYAEENSIVAPGQDINSANAANDSYEAGSGTSMATPHVSGVAGLVQQAFPYMNGKQLVDTLLSSANKSFVLPAFSVTLQTDSNAGGSVDYKFNVYYFGNKPDEATITQHLTDYYNANAATIKNYSRSNTDTLEKFLANARTVYSNVPREVIFGQGLLDAYSAVRGPASLNARRMDKNNISTAYGSTQALYRIDTQGYDSVWSNNITETKAALLAADSTASDLRPIYQYYKATDAMYGFAQGQEYIDTYNSRYRAGGASEGLLDLSVGLLKTGTGTLALTGSNSYTGSTIAAGGVLQIDGVVAGDAWSTETGTIAGSGTIAGNLRNLSIVRAGSYSEPGILTVGGSLASSGKIAVAVKNNIASQLKVTGAANIAGTAFQAVAGSTYKPDTIYPGVLTASSITGSFATTPFTGMLSAKGSIGSDGKSASLELVRANNLLNPTARQQQTYTSMERMYNQLQGQSAQRDLDTLYSLNPAQTAQALTEIYGGAQLDQAAAIQRDTTIPKAVNARLSYLKQAAGQTATASFTLPSFAPGSSMNAIIPIELDNASSWWMKTSKNWGSIDASSDHPSVDNQSFSVVIGTDRQAEENWRTGFLASYSNHGVTSGLAKSDSHGYRLGLYGGYSKGAFALQTYFDYGRQNNHTTRYLQQFQANSNYDSNTLSFGMGVRYNLHHDKKKVWQVSPYADFNMTRYSQDGFSETGAQVFNQRAGKFRNTYSTGEIGLEFGRSTANGRYVINVGYKKVLSGNNPDMAIAYSGNLGSTYTISGSWQDREYAVIGLNLQSALGKGWIVDTQIDTAMGKSSKYFTAAIVARRSW